MRTSHRLLGLLSAVLTRSAVATAQPPARPKITTRVDTVAVADMTAHLRARGDTLWWTLITTTPQSVQRRAKPTVALMQDTVVLLVRGQRVPAPPPLARALRDFYAQVRACPTPAAGCELDQALLRGLPPR